MSGPFGDPSDANRKPRGPRPFAGQVHPPGSGPLKSSRVRRPTLAPFPSPFAEHEPEARAAVQAPVPAPAPEIDLAPQSSIHPGLPATLGHESAAPAVPTDLPLPQVREAEGELPYTTSSAEPEADEPPFAAFSQAEPEPPAVDAGETSFNAFPRRNDDESIFAAFAEAPTEEIPFAPFAHAEPEDAQPRANTEDGPLSGSMAEMEANEAPTAPHDDAEQYEEFYAETFGEPEVRDIPSVPFVAAEAETTIDPFNAQKGHEEAPFSPAMESERFEWSAIDDLESRPESALHTDELRERDIEGEEAAQEPGMNAAAADADDDWFSEAAYSSRDGDLDEAPFDGIDSVGSTPRSLAAGGSAEEPPPLSLPVDWAVSPDGEADLQSYVVEVRIREEASEVLEGVARRVRSGEIVLALEPGASTEAVLASVLASLLA